MVDGARVLVIDDDPLFRSLIAKTLGDDFVVTLASNGEEGFHLASETPPDVAVIDVQMPGWDGLKTLAEFREHRRLKSIPVMMLTSDASKGSVMTAIDAGANDYILKTSFSKEDLRARVSRLADMHRNPVEDSQSQASSETGDASENVDALNRFATDTDESLEGLQELVDCWD